MPWTSKGLASTLTTLSRRMRRRPNSSKQIFKAGATPLAAMQRFSRLNLSFRRRTGARAQTRTEKIFGNWSANMIWADSCFLRRLAWTEICFGKFRKKRKRPRKRNALRDPWVDTPTPINVEFNFIILRYLEELSKKHNFTIYAGSFRVAGFLWSYRRDLHFIN